MGQTTTQKLIKTHRKVMEKKLNRKLTKIELANLTERIIKLKTIIDELDATISKII